MNYRGDVDEKEANEAIEYLKTEKKITMVDWCPTGINIGINKEVMPILDRDDLSLFKRNVVMMGNNPITLEGMYEMVSKKYDLMYSERAFVHWFVGEGMEEGEFAEAREDLGFLQMDYLDVLKDEMTDEDSDED